jgi:hypothetical protein
LPRLSLDPPRLRFAVHRQLCFRSIRDPRCSFPQIPLLYRSPLEPSQVWKPNISSPAGHPRGTRAANESRRKTNLSDILMPPCPRAIDFSPTTSTMTWSGPCWVLAALGIAWEGDRAYSQIASKHTASSLNPEVTAYPSYCQRVVTLSGIQAFPRHCNQAPCPSRFLLGRGLGSILRIIGYWPLHAT